jgi:HEAT repeat protein
MRKRRKKILIALTCLIVIAGIALVCWNAEPRYNGHSLSYWMDHFGSLNIATNAEEAKARDAISHIGTDAVPYLLKWMSYERDSSDRYPKNLVAELANAVAPTNSSTWSPSQTEDSLFRRANTSVFVLSLLGNRAKAAIPRLTEMLNPATDFAVRLRAARSLECIGEDGLPPLLAVLAQTNAPNRHFMASRVAKSSGLERNATLAIPVLVHCLDDSDPEISLNAVYALRRLAGKSPLVVPALTNCLRESAAPHLRRNATWALGQYGEQARVAMPLLLNQLTDPDLGVRIQTTNALQKIAPEVLTNSPSK